MKFVFSTGTFLIIDLNDDICWEAAKTEYLCNGETAAKRKFPIFIYHNPSDSSIQKRKLFNNNSLKQLSMFFQRLD